MGDGERAALGPGINGIAIAQRMADAGADKTAASGKIDTMRHRGGALYAELRMDLFPNIRQGM